MREPLTPEQIETALTIQSKLLAGVIRSGIAQGQMTTEEWRDLFGISTVDQNVSGRLFSGPLEPLYQLEQRR